MRFWPGIRTPREFRDLPPQDQIEMMAHRREVMLRENHASAVQRAVSEAEADRKR